MTARRTLLGFGAAALIAPALFAVGVWLFGAVNAEPAGPSELLGAVLMYTLVGTPIAAVFVLTLAVPLFVAVMSWLDPQRWHAVLGGVVTGVFGVTAIGWGELPALAIGGVAGALAALVFWSVARPDRHFVTE